MSITINETQDMLSADGDIVHHYCKVYKGLEGIIALSHKQALFLQMKGLLKRHYTAGLNLPDAHITQVVDVASHRFETTHNTTTSSIATLDTAAAIVVAALQHLIESITPTDTTVRSATQPNQHT